ncbi:hypothetical protein CAAN1_02S07228 [[Candida] anglica]|uniref:Uncharacterized protein n=1 Tax=[Candida] anglica TaxID=148631 RepID=A0ABP0EDU0_9ASCO
MSHRWKGYTLASEADLAGPVNDAKPLRIALLGGPRSGKSSIAGRLSLGSISETYYPTGSTNPILFSYTPEPGASGSILDPSDNVFEVQPSNKVVLSPVIEPIIRKRLKRNLPGIGQYNIQPTISSSSNLIIRNKTSVYSCIVPSEAIHATQENMRVPSASITPILVELIDTPPFNPDQVVPFLEESLYVQLDPHILRNLANEPRRPVSTNPLLVASGAGEMNGHIDGYFFVYSAIPSYEPPSYDESKSTNTDNNINSGKSYENCIQQQPGDTTFNLLLTIKGALDEAWKEYNTFRKSWEHGKEGDVFSFKGAFKNMWKDNRKIESEIKKFEQRQRSNQLHLVDNPIDPADPYCPPPIWLICTHADSELASPQLIEDGMKLAKSWRSGFVAVDSVSGNNVDESLACIIREIVERRKMQKRK